MASLASVPKARIEQMARTGQWPNRLLIDYLDEAARLRPDSVAVTGFNSMTRNLVTLSYRQLKRLSDRIALGLVTLGVERNDMVSCQLPNWWEFVALYLGCVRIGATLNPLMPILRERELSYMLGFAESVLIAVPRSFRGFDYPAMITSLRKDLPRLKRCLVVDGSGDDSFEGTLLARRWEDEMDAAAIFRERRPDPNDITQLLFTSGTTGQPKGVLHSSNTLLSHLVALNQRLGLTSQEVILMPSPLAHQIGFAYGLMYSIFLGGKLVLQDVWSADAAAQLIQDEQVTFSLASTPFLMDLTDSPAIRRYDIKSLAMFVCGGAPIPAALVPRARQRLGATIVAAWGMTEVGTTLNTRPLDPLEKVSNTDGTPLPGAEVRIVDDYRKPLPPGKEGHLEERATSDFVTYLKRPDLDNRGEDGWFDTGDLARMDEDGYVRITGRAKDVIIRGGENIPVVEVENLLYRHPAIQDAAVVAMPDERLGERACAFVTLQPGRDLSFSEMVRFLDEQRMARHYFPERLEILEAMPRTASGKIQKFMLREIAKELSARPCSNASSS